MVKTAAAQLGVAFGGGTARAIAQAGALKVLEDHDLAPSAVAGTSFGAIVAALYALHGSAAEVERIISGQRTATIWKQTLDFGLHQASIVHGGRLERWLDTEVFGGATFADTQKQLIIACTELERGSLVLLRSGSLARAVMASSSLPGLLASVRIDGQYLVDGGFIEAVPFLAAQALEPRLTLGLHAGIDTEHSRVVHTLQQLSRRQWARNVVQGMASARIHSAPGRLLRGIAWAGRSYLRPQPVPEGALLLRINPRIAWWDFHRSQEAIAAGEKAMLQALAPGSQLLALLEDSRGSVA
jgi:NTE family protein